MTAVRVAGEHRPSPERSEAERSPPLGEAGNSIRAQRAIAAISNALGEIRSRLRPRTEPRRSV
jgi:hypothetical protein